MKLTLAGGQSTIYEQMRCRKANANCAVNSSEFRSSLRVSLSFCCLVIRPVSYSAFNAAFSLFGFSTGIRSVKGLRTLAVSIFECKGSFGRSKPVDLRMRDTSMALF